jgi:hypothetical protein
VLAGKDENLIAQFSADPPARRRDGCQHPLVNVRIGKSRIETIIGRGYRFCESPSVEAVHA